MFVKTIATASALLAGAVLAQDCGSAVVQNACDYDVYIFNTPAEGGGQQTIQQKLEPNETYSQQWTSLTNGMGWSIKLSKSEELGDNIMQYEYTYHDDGIIWYDLSDVNGNPWNGDWMVDASNSESCHPKQQAYCFSTDDAYGMQACSAEAHITVTLCSVAEIGNDACNTASAAATSYVSAAPTSYSASEPESSEAPSSTTFSTPSHSAPQWMSPHTWYAVTPTTSSEAETSEAPSSTYAAPAAPTSEAAAYEEPSSSAYVAPTTFATSAAPVVSAPPGEVIVTDTAVDIVTQIVTATAWAKRHEHHPRHPHNRE